MTTTPGLVTLHGRESGLRATRAVAKVPGYRVYVEPYDVPPEGLCARAINRPDRTGDTPPPR
jgi:hypothetical protein